jgi:endonuclease/exonuclease/phosphatase family metal-dependent hydrolase
MSGEPVRVVTLNIWQEQGPWARRMELLAERLAALDADVVCLQEVRVKAGSIPNQARTLADRLDMSWTYELAQEWGGGEEGLAILTRLPPVERDHRELPFTEGRSRRICLGVALEISDVPLWIFTTHLAWRLADGALRERQVEAVEAFRVQRSRGAVTIVTGDFNAPPDADEIRFLKGLTSLGGQRTYLQDAFELCNPGMPGHTWCRANPYTQALGWLEPDRRLDYIFVSPMTRQGAGTIHGCRLVCTEPDERGIWCSDHYGLLAEIDVSGVGDPTRQ